MEEKKSYEDEIDLTQLIKILFKRKWLIIGGTLIFTIAAVVYSFLLPRVYRSDGFFQFPKEISEQVKMEIREQVEMQAGIKKNISIPDFKKGSSLCTNQKKFVEFVVSRGYYKGEELEEIKKSIETSGDLVKGIEPVFSLTKEDTKELAQISRDDKIYVVGVQLRGEKQSPEKAQKFVKIFGLFIKCCFLNSKLENYINSGINISQTGLNKYENETIRYEFKLNQLNKKLHDIKGLLKKYPQSKMIVRRELVSVDKGGYRYLSPITQLVGIESHIADIKERLAHFYREKELMGLKFAFFSKAQDILNSGILGEALLNRIIKLKEEILKTKSGAVNTVKEVSNELTIDFDDFAWAKAQMRFVSGPTLPKNPIKPKKKLIVIISFFISVFIFIFIAFIQEWWQSNKKIILKKGNQL